MICPHCEQDIRGGHHQNWGFSPAYKNHLRRCERASETDRAFFIKHHRWLKRKKATRKEAP